MITKRVLVTQAIDVTVDETKFSPEFMAEFRESFYQFHTLDQHIEHLAQMCARGLYTDSEFIEGYGPAPDMGIKFKDDHVETEIV